MELDRLQHMSDEKLGHTMLNSFVFDSTALLGTLIVIVLYGTIYCFIVRRAGFSPARGFELSDSIALDYFVTAVKS